MRRAVFIAAAVIMTGLLIFLSYLIFTGFLEKAEYDDITISGAKIENGRFSARIKCDREGFHIAKCEYEIEDDTIYITVYLTTYEEKGMGVDIKGYTSCEYDVGDAEIEYCYYRRGESKDEIELDYGDD